MKTTIIKEQRQENILLSLKKLGFLSRSQIQKLHRLGGTRNTNRILKDMQDFLNVVRLHENVYYLNAEGRQRVGETKVLKRTHQITHHLMRNSLYLAFGCPATWKNEVKLIVKDEVSVIADAVFTMAGTYHIIEVDHTQKMIENREKIKKYRRLIELGVFEKPPKFIWATTTEYRKKQLLSLCKGMQVRVYLANEFN
ncbi:replication-relaxation family protein [Bacillus sp. V3B]|uniref:replication-relaxation family protein n=1 Tax=Bacillus sp. V3B TaxID=2804915 RepID=UPI0021093D9B|nr:replication-relaxation family protein [Bacillus sp. V3B]MCQ6275737.1 replication-relaxation family protein [Bacillus sp. V3B]